MRRKYYLLVFLIVLTIVAFLDISSGGLRSIAAVFDRFIVQTINGDVHELDEQWYERSTE